MIKIIIMRSNNGHQQKFSVENIWKQLPEGTKQNKSLTYVHVCDVNNQ